jgi:hypothetical protein
MQEAWVHAQVLQKSHVLPYHATRRQGRPAQEDVRAPDYCTNTQQDLGKALADLPPGLNPKPWTKP